MIQGLNIRKRRAVLFASIPYYECSVLPLGGQFFRKSVGRSSGDWKKESRIKKKRLKEQFYSKSFSISLSLTFFFKILSFFSVKLYPWHLLFHLRYSRPLQLKNNFEDFEKIECDRQCEHQCGLSVTISGTMRVAIKVSISVTIC